MATAAATAAATRVAGLPHHPERRGLNGVRRRNLPSVAEVAGRLGWRLPADSGPPASTGGGSRASSKGKGAQRQQNPDHKCKCARDNDDGTACTKAFTTNQRLKRHISGVHDKELNHTQYVYL